jgi:two-component system OmpR family response regulator
VVLLDLCMTGVDGYEVARQLQTMDAPPLLVAVTGLGSDWDRQRAHEAGFTLYLTKPVPPEELVMVVRQCGQSRGGE